MKKPRINKRNDLICMHHAGATYQFPKAVAEKYRVANSDNIDASDVFADINKKYTKPGSLLRGIRMRENLTQVELAEKLKMTQSDVSQMENGVRSIGRTVAKRIAALFDIDYRALL